MGEQVIGRLIETGVTVLVKLHENSRDLRHANSGGIDWPARLQPLLRRGNGLLIDGSDVSPWLVAADVLISDHSSVAFEYLLLDRPVVRIHLPELIARGAVAAEYVELMTRASTTATTPRDVQAAVDHALADPRQGSADRRAVASELFYKPGTATDRAVRELYEVMELEPLRPTDTQPAFNPHEAEAVSHAT
jgi:CDP-glycerol glycerophosphotransferase (TagB/SpsB family)